LGLLTAADFYGNARPNRHCRRNIGDSLAFGPAAGWRLGFARPSTLKAIVCHCRHCRRNIGGSLALGLAVGWRLGLLTPANAEGNARPNQHYHRNIGDSLVLGSAVGWRSGFGYWLGFGHPPILKAIPLCRHCHRNIGRSLALGLAVCWWSSWQISVNCEGNARSCLVLVQSLIREQLYGS